jgi:PAS domain-containing protein
MSQRHGTHFMLKLILIVHVQIFASDSFLELTEYTREEILGRNCRYEITIFYIVV